MHFETSFISQQILVKYLTTLEYYCFFYLFFFVMLEINSGEHLSWPWSYLLSYFIQTIHNVWLLHKHGVWTFFKQLGLLVFTLFGIDLVSIHDNCHRRSRLCNYNKTTAMTKSRKISPMKCQKFQTCLILNHGHYITFFINTKTMYIVYVYIHICIHMYVSFKLWRTSAHL